MIKNPPIKALFFDIDGTLVPYGLGHIPEEVSEAIAAVRAKGVKVFISTGRHLHWINNLGDTEFDGYVTVNGGMCLDADKTTCIHKTCIDPSDVERLAEFSSHHDIPLVVVPAKEDIFITRHTPEVEFVAEELHLPFVPLGEVKDALGKDVVQLMAFGSEEDRRHSGLFGETLLHCEPTSWNPYFCDIIPKGSDKSAGLEAMASHFGFDISETMAFGDGSNDIGMLRTAGIGVAMGNADPEVKAAADYVTTDDTDHGVINALRHFGLIE
ncbi:MAG: Cof-type HAD-IIB family hydrolase [Muribaculaceae bacterium]|nr:Cof-type HAD-IIB family hydrolase [Muribaculaceae bacterium]